MYTLSSRFIAFTSQGWTPSIAVLLFGSGSVSSILPSLILNRVSLGGMRRVFRVVSDDDLPDEPLDAALVEGAVTNEEEAA
ncbi:MAG: hypothetical protein FGF53_05915, partial [Candidatus Brockarchaeota archaeon]|nr:hypothetical protein [Candidatus Brockarchaeota archaeon]